MKTLLALFTIATPLLAQCSIPWEQELATALKRARIEKKCVLVDVWAEWCGPCQTMKSQIFPSPEGQKALGHFIPVSLMVQSSDGTFNSENMKVAEEFKVKAYPTLLVLDSEGREIRRQVGAFRSGAEFAIWAE